MSEPIMLSKVPSAACDAVFTAEHPSHEDGGPCHDCAFRSGSEASQHAHTADLARLCVEGFREFRCHVHPGLCRGYIAALNLRGVPQDEDDKKWSIIAGHAADAIAMCIDSARREQELAESGSRR